MNDSLTFGEIVPLALAVAFAALIFSIYGARVF